MSLVLKINTTGLPKSKGFNQYFDYKDIKKYDSSRLLSVEFATSNEVKRFVVKLDDGIPNIKNKQFHGIDEKMIENKGVIFTDIINEIIASLMDCNDGIKCFGLDFTMNVLMSELYRSGQNNAIEILNNIPKKCMMKDLTNVLKIPLGNSAYKSPTAKEAYEYVCGKKIDDVSIKNLNEICIAYYK